MDARSTKVSAASRAPPSAIIVDILKLLPPNQRALSGRHVFREARECLSGPEHCTASLSQPLPPHAALWAQEAVQQRLRELAFHEKPQLLCAAVASGCEVNVAAAWGALQPSFFSGVPDIGKNDEGTLPACAPCPGVAAVRAGHLRLLSWLARNCPALLKPRDCVIEAARHCDLAGLQTVLQAVGSMLTASSWCEAVLEAAAESATGDVAKLEWLLATHSDQRLRVTHETAQAAVRSGDWGRLRWLHGRGCLLSTEGVASGFMRSGLTPGDELLVAALQYADLTTVQWLMDEAGCRLELPPDCYWPSTLFFAAAIKGPDSVAKVQWLQQQGVGSMLARVVGEAVQADNLDMLLHLQSQCGPAGSKGHARLQQAMAATGACPASIAVAQQLHAAGNNFSPELCYRAAEGGHVALLRWLVHEAGVSAAGLEPWGDMTLQLLIENWRPAPRVLLEVVKLLLEAGYQAWDAERAVRAAVRRGDLALTNYLLHLKPWCQQGAGLMAAAAHGGCEALLEQLVEQQQQQGFEASGGRLYVETAARGDRVTLTALRRLGVPWGAGDVVVQAAWAGAHPPALRWLVEQGAPVGDRYGVHKALWYRLGRLSSDTMAWLDALCVPDGQLTARPASAATNAPTGASGAAAYAWPPATLSYRRTAPAATHSF